MKINIKKHKCCMCGKEATWYKHNHQEGDALYYCDDCVPRGSLENVCDIYEDDEPIPNVLTMWWDEDASESDLKKDGYLTRNTFSSFYEYLDKDGRRFPSNAFSFNLKGYPIKEEERIVSIDDIYLCYARAKREIPPYQGQSLGTIIAEILFNEKVYKTDKTIKYNLFMCKLGEKIKDLLPLVYNKHNNIIKFYRKFKSELFSLREVEKRVPSMAL